MVRWHVAGTKVQICNPQADRRMIYATRAAHSSLRLRIANFFFSGHGGEAGLRVGQDLKILQAGRAVLKRNE